MFGCFRDRLSLINKYRTTTYPFEFPEKRASCFDGGAEEVILKSDGLKMSMRNIPLFKVAMNERAGAALNETLRSGFIGQGPREAEFKDALSAQIGNPLILAVNSCTSALHLALHLLKTRKPPAEPDFFPPVEHGDEVLTPALTCTATNWPILANGLRLKWVDTDPETLNLSLEDLSEKLSPTTKIIMLVHWGGYPVDLNQVRELQEVSLARFGFRPYVIEDCAHSWASTYEGRRLGNHGNICAFSFQAIKHLTCGDGGALVLPMQELYRRGKLLRWFGIDREARTDFRCEDDIEEYGFKFHMNDINATIGLMNLEIVDDVIARHRDNARFYNTQLQGTPGLRLLQESRDDRESSYWIYSMLVENRAGFVQRMSEAGIMVSPVHNRNDFHTCVAEFASPLPRLDYVSERMISIPVGWWVNGEDREYIVETIKQGW